LELDPPPAFPDQAESASTASHATSTSAQSAVEQVADSAKPLESVPVATVVLPACPCPDGAGFPFRYEFLSPAHFAWRGFGQREDLVEREGIIIYEGMRLEWNESGRYRLTFFTNWAEVPATLRLQLLVRQCERGAVHTITIPAITLDADRRNRRLALVPDGMAQDEFRGASLDATFQTPDQDRGRRTALPSFRISGTGTLDGSRSTQDQALWNLNGRIEPEDRPSHTSDKDERSHLQRQVVEGYSPAIEQACGRLAEIRRSGTARFGYSSVHASQVAASPR
jgi:hypothetical protein